MQKTHNHGTDGKRYFWNVTTQEGSGEYRSRHATSKGVRAEFAKNGHSVKSVTKAKG